MPHSLLIRPLLRISGIVVQRDNKIDFNIVFGENLTLKLFYCVSLVLKYHVPQSSIEISALGTANYNNNYNKQTNNYNNNYNKQLQ